MLWHAVARCQRRVARPVYILLYFIKGSYQDLSPKTRVHFGKTGSWAWAVAVGDMTVMGPLGVFHLHGVTHVPELSGPLYPVKRAVARGMSFP